MIVFICLQIEANCAENDSIYEKTKGYLNQISFEIKLLLHQV
jgi:hypothetical protein